MKESKELCVFISFKDEECAECGKEIYKGNITFFTKDRMVICLSCADLSHLIFLSSGNAALTRRAKKHSTLYAVVLKHSRARRRNERQGLLVEEQALEKAEEECLADSELREIRRKREQERREKKDNEYIKSFAEKIRSLYPHIPKDREYLIAGHACEKYSGRIGRTAFAKKLDEEVVSIAVIAHIRHWETHYDELIMQGMERFEAREMVKEKIDEVLRKWKG